MSQKLPVNGFEWVKETSEFNEEFKKIKVQLDAAEERSKSAEAKVNKIILTTLNNMVEETC